MAGILVVSAPRSGSSCTTGLLHLHGFPLGKDHSAHTDKFNEKGYFENQKILDFNRKVLNDIKVDVFLTELPTDDQIERSLNHREELVEILSDQFSGDFLIKDPRIAILQNLYLSTLPPVKVILLERKSEDVAKSIQRMRDFPLEKGIRIHGIYSKLMNMLAEKCICKKVQFENILSQMPDVCDWLGVEYREKESLEFVEDRLVHFK